LLLPRQGKRLQAIGGTHGFASPRRPPRNDKILPFNPVYDAAIAQTAAPTSR
jgi:hypothetical protein